MSYVPCPSCGYFTVQETQHCERCTATLGFHWPTLAFRSLDLDHDGDGLLDGVDIDATVWNRCTNWAWGCNWLAPEDGGSGFCFSCRLTRRRPDADDTIALEMMAEASVAKQRLVAQLLGLGLPVTPYYEAEGGLAFDLILGDRKNR